MSIDPNLRKTEEQYNIKVESKTVEFYEKKDPAMYQGTSLITSSKKAKSDPERKMNAAVYKGTKNIQIVEVPRPLITDQTDAIVRITASSICNSEVSLFSGDTTKNITEGTIFGHEAVGIVEDVGVGIKRFKKGDRVVVSPVIACGECDFCKRGEMSCCELTNSSVEQKEMWGHNTAALFGFNERIGGIDGCHAEYVRIPIADVNLFPIPDGVDDRTALLVPDIAATGFHGCELADIKPGDSVVIFGCGPVGLMTAMFARYRKAKTVISVDVDSSRLEIARKNFKVETINSSDVDPVNTILKILPLGPDKIIDCVGYKSPSSFLSKVQRTFGIDSDTPNLLNTSIQLCRKNGRIALLGDYIGNANNVNLGTFMNKHLTLSGGQLWPHKYQERIFQALKLGDIDPTVIFTHTIPLSKLSSAYDLISKREDNVMKVLIVPDMLKA